MVVRIQEIYNDFDPNEQLLVGNLIALGAKSFEELVLDFAVAKYQEWIEAGDRDAAREYRRQWPELEMEFQAALDGLEEEYWEKKHMADAEAKYWEEREEREAAKDEEL